MSHHVYCNWQWIDEINDTIVEAIATGLEGNKWAGRYTPPCFALLTIGDMILMNLAQIIDRAASQEEPITENTLSQAVPDDFKFKAKAVEVCKKILVKLDLFDKVLPKPKELSEETIEEAMKNYPLPGKEEFEDHFQKQVDDINRVRKEEAERN